MTTHTLPALIEGQPETASVTIALSDTEAQLFALLRRAAARQTAAPPLVLRVAGGWVRDKLLGLASHDIDIAVNCPGTQLAALVQAQLVEEGRGASTIGVIQANPEQSKHLETATMRVPLSGGEHVDVDFVNLRTETYASSSRIPAIAIGTAREDAQRRDFTVNALFYNLTTDAIEDLTGRVSADIVVCSASLVE
jgi:tRNA nucleotidyltransferase (CCA-adding enzyme)